ncbi:very short patch repair endonuclease [Microbacterium sp. zg.Y1090]|uniref:very short patch repair endonuclease n=1 Tax=Microbacterium wangruii TaxID=3049073 RepID=UPI00214C174A|nr:MULTISPECIES: very short patch repair endonuclease [unclassified Microbacterium]MCR2817315.1 very short patch repair endonuclease [Microbacterium sp. zg.Y1090]WIM29197.1 very short patch repair endonuclease [Microbacterium sp. zg-Y1090]
MADSWASSEGTRKSMLANKRRDTSTEIAARRELQSRGLRYRVDFAPVPGLRRRADVVFTRARIAVFIDGCFWHGCPIHGTAPRRNADYWGPKLAANVARDRDTDRRLSAAGWIVARFWEHESAREIADTVELLARKGTDEKR